MHMTGLYERLQALQAPDCSARAASAEFAYCESLLSGVASLVDISVQWAHDLGLLGRGTILGHALFVDTHSWMRWHTKSDLKLLGDSGTAVAHCPTPFARYGHIMEHFGDYLRAGVTMGVGTDCSPHNLIEEMRKATVLAHIAARDIHSVTAADLFHAATVGGANALMRDDIGRLAPGKKADIVLVDLACPQT